MAITLRVSSHHAQHMGANATRIFESGGDIGRVASNDWVLPDPERFISGQHARITERGGQYFLSDLSTNGTQLNGRELPRGSEMPLGNGDVIGIGDYQIAVMIDASMPQIPAGYAPPPMQPQAPLQMPQQQPAVTPGPGASVDPLDFFGDSPSAPPEPAFNSVQPDNVPAEQEFFKPPVMSPAATPQQSGGIPDDWNEAPDDSGGIPDDWMKTGISSAPEPQAPAAPQPSAPPAADPFSQTGTIQQPAPMQPSPGGGNHLDDFLRGAGLDPNQVDPATIEAMGGILRIAVQGLVELLQSRAEFKNQFRVAKTALKPIDNNPLKLSATAEDALFNMFVKPTPGYQSPADAFQEGIDDIKAHQIAMMAGMRAGYKAIMDQFDPDRLEESFNAGPSRGRLLDVVSKTKFWDMYRKMCDDLGDDDQTFRRLFGDEFAEEYEKQMQRMARLRARS